MIIIRVSMYVYISVFSTCARTTFKSINDQIGNMFSLFVTILLSTHILERLKAPEKLTKRPQSFMKIKEIFDLIKKYYELHTNF